jgi:hypothetical protein
VEAVAEQLTLYVNRPRLCQDVHTLQSVFTALQPAAHLKGNSLRFCMDGTIPIDVSHVSYNIPIRIWLGPNYPAVYPEVCLLPTSSLRVAPNHKFVDKAGTVYHPYISQWHPQTSNLLQLVIELCSTFSREPPMYDVSSMPHQSQPCSSPYLPPQNPAPMLSPQVQPNASVPSLEQAEEPASGSVNDDLICVICMDKRKCVIFLPCRHLCTCQTCSESVSTCPNCRQPVQSKIKAYL